jgi:hypothetical protein
LEPSSATVVLGLAGSLVGFLVFTELLGIGDNEAFDLGGLVCAVIGVMLLLGVGRALQRDKPEPSHRAPPPQGLLLASLLGATACASVGRSHRQASGPGSGPIGASAVVDRH